MAVSLDGSYSTDLSGSDPENLTTGLTLSDLGFLWLIVTTRENFGISNITQTGAIWSNIIDDTFEVNQGYFSVWYAENIFLAGDDISISFVAPVSAGAVLVAEFSGVTPAALVLEDQAEVSKDLDNSVDSGAITPTANNLLVGFTAARRDDRTFSITSSGYTLIDNVFGTGGGDAFDTHIYAYWKDAGASPGSQSFQGNWSGAPATDQIGGIQSYIAAVTGPPALAINPDPANGATGVSLTKILGWDADVAADSHDVYFGTDPDPSGNFQGNQVPTTFDPGTLTQGTTYYWRIDEVNTFGTTTGDVWNFTTLLVVAAGKAINPVPGNGSENVAELQILSWTAGAGAVTHDVYFGTDPDPSNSFQGNQAGTTFDPGRLLPGVVYYWRVDELNALSEVTTGDVWSFSTDEAVLKTQTTKIDTPSGENTGDVEVQILGVQGNSKNSATFTFNKPEAEFDIGETNKIALSVIDNILKK